MYMKLSGPTTYEAIYSKQDARDEDDDVELRDEALNNGEENLTVTVVVQALQDEALSNGDEEAFTIAEEVCVEGLKERRPSACPLKTCSLK